MPLLPLYEYHVRKKTCPDRRPCVPVVSFAMYEVLARRLSCARMYKSFLSDQDSMKMTENDTKANSITHRHVFAVPSEREDGLRMGAMTGDSRGAPPSSGLKQ